MSEWISVKDLPAPKNKPILCYTSEFGGVQAVMIWEEDGWNGSNWYGSLCHEYSMEFSHWMPLPEPPK